MSNFDKSVNVIANQKKAFLDLIGYIAEHKERLHQTSSLETLASKMSRYRDSIDILYEGLLEVEMYPGVSFKTIVKEQVIIDV